MPGTVNSSGKAPKAGRTVQTRFTSRNPSLGCNSRWCSRVPSQSPHPANAVQPAARALDLGRDIPRLDRQGPEQQRHDKGQREPHQHPCKDRQNGKNIAHQMNVALT